MSKDDKRIKSSAENYVIATSRPWNEILVQRLHEKTGHKFHLITSKEQLTAKALETLNPRYVFFPHWSYIIPPEIYTAYECVVFHMTDLPYGRGGSPLQNLILRGHKDTQLTAIQCTAELDAGPIYLKRPLSLEGSASDIFERATKLTEQMIGEIILKEPVPSPQQGDAGVFQRRRPADSNLASARVSSLNDFYDFIRMLDAEGYPKAFVDLHGHRIELSQVQIHSGNVSGTFVITRLDSLDEAARGRGRAVD